LKNLFSITQKETIKVRAQLNDTRGLMKSYNNGSAYKNIGRYEKKLNTFSIKFSRKFKRYNNIIGLLNVLVPLSIVGKLFEIV
jgi:hypothetical protein